MGEKRAPLTGCVVSQEDGTLGPGVLIDPRSASNCCSKE